MADDQPSAPRRSVLAVDLRDAFAMAEYLLEVHGLDGWEVSYDNAKRRAGICHFTEQTLGLSAPLTAVHSEDEVRDTILHEIAHALVGPGHQHDAVWRATALRIGSSGDRCVSPDAPRVQGDWVGTCPAGHQRHRHRRPQRPQSCARCHPTFDVRHLLTWTYRGRRVRMSPGYEEELALLRAAPARAADGPPATVVRLSPGSRARCLAPGRYYGVVGNVVKRGRTRYHLRVPAGILTVPFALVEAA